jgi:hypothetical protein
MLIQHFIDYIKIDNQLNSEDEKLAHKYFKVINAKENEILKNKGEILSFFIPVLAYRKNEKYYIEFHKSINFNETNSETVNAIKTAYSYLEKN